jgi:hypothetical protein
MHSDIPCFRQLLYKNLKLIKGESKRLVKKKNKLKRRVCFQVQLKSSPGRTKFFNQQEARLLQNPFKPTFHNKLKRMDSMGFTNESQTKGFRKYERLSKLSKKFPWTFKPYRTRTNPNCHKKSRKNPIN